MTAPAVEQGTRVVSGATGGGTALTTAQIAGGATGAAPSKERSLQKQVKKLRKQLAVAKQERNRCQRSLSGKSEQDAQVVSGAIAPTTAQTPGAGNNVRPAQGSFNWRQCRSEVRSFTSFPRRTNPCCRSTVPQSLPPPLFHTARFERRYRRVATKIARSVTTQEGRCRATSQGSFVTTE